MAEEVEKEIIEPFTLSKGVFNRIILKKDEIVLDKKEAKPYKSAIEELGEYEPSLWEMFWFLLTKAPKLIYYLVKLVKLIEELKNDYQRKK